METCRMAEHYRQTERTGQQKSYKSVIFHIFGGGEAPRKDIAMKFGTGVDVLDVVTVAEFDLENLRGVNFTGVTIWASPLTLPMGLNKV